MTLEDSLSGILRIKPELRLSIHTQQTSLAPVLGNRGENKMASAHFQTAANCLQENLNLLADTSGEVKSENQPLWNLSNALLALSDALHDEFNQIHTELTYIQQRLG
jgi:hypothetical protein